MIFSKFATIPLVAQSPSPVPTTVDIPLPTAGNAIWIALAAVGGALINQVFPQLLAMWNKKEDAESALTGTLISNLLTNNQKLLEGNLAGFHAVEEGQKSVEKAILNLGETIRTEVQSTLKAQSGIYAASTKSLTEIEFQLKAVHERMDNYELLMNSLANQYGLADQLPRASRLPIKQPGQR